MIFRFQFGFLALVVIVYLNLCFRICFSLVLLLVHPADSLGLVRGAKGRSLVPVALKCAACRSQPSCFDPQPQALGLTVSPPR
jgi:hypothetical protein